MSVPLFLPVGQRVFGFLQRIRRRLLNLPSLLKSRHQLTERHFEFFNLGLILVNMACDLFSTENRLVQVRFLTFTQFTGVLD